MRSMGGLRLDIAGRGAILLSLENSAVSLATVISEGAGIVLRLFNLQALPCVTRFAVALRPARACDTELC